MCLVFAIWKGTGYEYEYEQINATTIRAKLGLDRRLRSQDAFREMVSGEELS
jgi:hypothetical protein